MLMHERPVQLHVLLLLKRLFSLLLCLLQIYTRFLWKNIELRTKQLDFKHRRTRINPGVANSGLARIRLPCAAKLTHLAH